MKVGSARYTPLGGMHRVPLPGVEGPGLVLTALAVVGPDPAAALDAAGADVLICLQTAAEVSLWHPAYLDWLAAPPPPYRAQHQPVPDLGVLADDELAALASSVVALAGRGHGVLAHCGAGLGRAGQLAIATLLALGTPLDDALTVVRASRPGAGPQSEAQADQLRRLRER